MPGRDSADQTHSRVSNINLLFFFGWGGVIYIPWKIPNGKVLAHLGFKSKIFPGSLTDLGTCVRFCTSSPQQGVKYQLRYLDSFFFGWGECMYIPWRISNGKVLAHLGFKSKVLHWTFNWLKCLVGILHLKPTAGCYISTLIFRFVFVLGGYSIYIPWKIPNGKVLAHLGFKSKVLLGPLTDLSACVGFCTWSPQQTVKYQLQC